MNEWVGAGVVAILAGLFWLSLELGARRERERAQWLGRDRMFENLRAMGRGKRRWWRRWL